VLLKIYLSRVYNEPYNHITDSHQQFTLNCTKAGAAFETLTRVNGDGVTPDCCLLFQIVGEAIRKR
jgi:hypothetical protein